MVVKRRYDSTWRREQARATRRAILAAARKLFVESGYAATTLVAVTREAGVAVPTVYGAFAGKRQLLSEMVDVAIAGDDEPVALPDRAFVADIRALPAARAKLRRFAEHLVEVHAREAEVMLALAGAATADRDAAAVWRKYVDDRRTGMAGFAADLVATGEVRPSLTADEVVDVLWLAMDVGGYDWLVRARGWPHHRYIEWYVTSVTGSILL